MLKNNLYAEYVGINIFTTVLKQNDKVLHVWSVTYF